MGSALLADSGMENPPSSTGTVNRKPLIVLIIAMLVLAGVVTWRSLDAGDVTPDAAPAGQDAPSLEALIAAAESDPDNPAAWQELGFAYFERGEFADAARAYRQAIENDGQNAVLWSSLGEARVMASERDPMPPAAVEAFEKAIALDPSDPRARYFLAVRKDLAGDHEGAIADWLALLADTPAGAPWEADLKRTIEQVGTINAIATDQRIAAALAERPEAPAGPAMSTAQAGIPGPTAEQLAAASAIAPGEQRDMAEGMVARLESRLEGDPANVEGWIMLMRSRVTLGQQDAARAALARAIAANPGAEARLRSEAGLLGVR